MGLRAVPQRGERRAGSSTPSRGRTSTRGSQGEGGAGLGRRGSAQGLCFTVAGKGMVSLFGIAGACF